MMPWHEEIRDKYGYKISNSLKRSKSRTRSLIYIGYHPNQTILEISLGTRICYANTYGAIIGDGKKYSKDCSLAGMDIVSCKVAYNAYACALTETGNKIFEILKAWQGPL
jgi:predicted transcriptional regulator with HTH domain